MYHHKLIEILLFNNILLNIIVIQLFIFDVISKLKRKNVVI